jgi:8-oxo-dGTP diphosphatase
MAIIQADKRSVAGIVRRADKYLVARRLPGGAMGEKWEFPGGKVEPGEDDRSALAREYLEEFAVEASVGEALAEAVFRHRSDRIALTAYAVELKSDAFRLTEHSAWRWASLDEIAGLDFADSDRKLLPSLRRRFGAAGRDQRRAENSTRSAVPPDQRGR